MDGDFPPGDAPGMLLAGAGRGARVPLDVPGKAPTPPSPRKTPPLCIGAGMEGVSTTGGGGHRPGLCHAPMAKAQCSLFGCLRARLTPPPKKPLIPIQRHQQRVPIPRAFQGRLAFTAIFILFGFLQQKQEAVWQRVLLGSGRGAQELVGSPEARSQGLVRIPFILNSCDLVWNSLS